MLSERELATVLAALRYWQREGWVTNGREHDIATDGGKFDPLSADDISKLCERLNTSPAPTKLTLRSPSGRLIVGTSEKVPGMAPFKNVYAVPEDGSPFTIEYDEPTKLYWEGAETVTRDGERLYIDEDGKEWMESELVKEAALLVGADGKK